MTLRDDLLPIVDLGNELAQEFGLSRFVVILRRRIWSGESVGDGGCTTQDIVMSPPPTVVFRPPFAMQLMAMQSAGSLRDRYYLISDITPFFVNPDGSTGGFTPAQLRMRAAPDLKNVDPLIILIGDDGMLRECEQIYLEDADPFAYKMLVQETDNPGVLHTALAITPAAPSLLRGTKQQMRAMATYQDGNAYPVTTLMRWTSSNPLVASVDLLGVVTAMADGTASIAASLGTMIAPAQTVTVTG